MLNMHEVNGVGSADYSRPRLAHAGDVSRHFPMAVRERLVKAAAVRDCQVRTKEIDRVVEWARLRYPQLFRAAVG